MFVYSVKSSKIKMAILILLVVLLVLAMLLVTRLHQPAEADSELNIKAENAEQRVAFLSQFGWSFDEDPVEVAEVIIPPEFDEVYEKYNEIQKAQGFDLTKYQGKRVKRWTYAIKNYPGYAADSGCIHANLLVYEGQVIGGDVCSVELRFSNRYPFQCADAFRNRSSRCRDDYICSNKHQRGIKSRVWALIDPKRFSAGSVSPTGLTWTRLLAAVL